MSRYPYQQGDDLRLKSSRKKMYNLRHFSVIACLRRTLLYFATAFLFSIQTALSKTNIRLPSQEKAALYLQPHILRKSNHILNAGLD